VAAACRVLRVTAPSGVAQPWNVPRCIRPALFEPDRRGARLDGDKRAGGVGKLKKSASLSNFLAQPSVSG